MRAHDLGRNQAGGAGVLWGVTYPGGNVETSPAAGRVTTARRPALTTMSVLRVALVVIAALQGAGVASGLAGRSHSGHEIATWSLAASVGLLTAAIRPATAGALLPVLATACVISAAVTVRDIATGAVTAGDEAPHLLLAAGVLLLVLVSAQADLGD